MIRLILAEMRLSVFADLRFLRQMGVALMVKTRTNMNQRKFTA